MIRGESMARRHIYFGLSWFDKHTEDLVGELPLNISARELRRILGLGARASLSDSFPVTPQHLSYLKAVVSHPLNLAQFDYFIEASSSPVPASEPALR
jgi:hypothetical protein